MWAVGTVGTYSCDEGDHHDIYMRGLDIVSPRLRLVCTLVHEEYISSEGTRSSLDVRQQQETLECIPQRQRKVLKGAKRVPKGAHEPMSSRSRVGPHKAVAGYLPELESVDA